MLAAILRGSSRALPFALTTKEQALFPTHRCVSLLRLSEAARIAQAPQLIMAEPDSKVKPREAGQLEAGKEVTPGLHRSRDVPGWCGMPFH